MIIWRRLKSFQENICSHNKSHTFFFGKPLRNARVFDKRRNGIVVENWFQWVFPGIGVNTCNRLYLPFFVGKALTQCFLLYLGTIFRTQQVETRINRKASIMFRAKSKLFSTAEGSYRTYLIHPSSFYVFFNYAYALLLISDPISNSYNWYPPFSK